MTERDGARAGASGRSGRGGRAQRRAERETSTPAGGPHGGGWPVSVGGRLKPISDGGCAAIVAGAYELLETLGLSEAPTAVVALVVDAGGTLGADGRLRFPAPLVAQAVRELGRPITLAGRRETLDLELSPARVFLGSGGAAPLVIDLDSGSFRPSTLADLHDAARIVDALSNAQFFSRSLVARDMPDAHTLDLNTAYASLAGTSKHVMVAAQNVESVRAIAEMCAIVAGSEQAFRERPFLSLNINHVAPPMRFAPEAAEVLVEATRLGIPAQVNTFGQLGASSPVTIAGCLAQSLAETLAGMVVAWLVDPEARAVFGMRPMVTDLRTGGMAGGGGEQALLTAAAVQISNHCGLPNSTIAGATDSKVPDIQSGYERALAVALAAQAGANLVTQACGMQAGLMAVSFESYLIDDDMLGAVLRTLAPIEVDEATLSIAAIGDVVRGEGHFLGHHETLARMQSDFLYPNLADRRSPEAWEAAGSPDIREAARARVRELLARPPLAHLTREVDARLRERFDIRLDPARVGAA